ncbi:MAG TPA: 2'-5' RNA ligase family protein [Actinomycetales bacterium]|nr:2'-5' RNA ligase family protein [Actinomycetales bacterium]
MVQTVELLLDQAAEAVVRDQWTTLASLGLPSQARHTGATNRPHVTLAVAAAMPAALDPRLAQAVTELPVPVLLGGLVVFRGRRGSVVLSRLVVPSAALMALHAAVADVVADCPDRPANLRPGAWTPHVTLARGLTPEQVGPAVAACSASTLEAVAVTARRYDGDRKGDWLLTTLTP